MPYVSIVTNAELTAEAEKRIKASITRVMEDVAKKPEQWLMIAIQSSQPMFFQGSGDTRTAFVEIKYIGAFPSDVKLQIVKALGKSLHDAAGISADKFYVHFEGSPATEWGWSGSMFG
jgi:phenylpyruvate tautomerase PptA (4-oxalocrotonate tautomerase family)